MFWFLVFVWLLMLINLSVLKDELTRRREERLELTKEHFVILVPLPVIKGRWFFLVFSAIVITLVNLFTNFSFAFSLVMNIFLGLIFIFSWILTSAAMRERLEIKDEQLKKFNTKTSYNQLLISEIKHVQISPTQANIYHGKNGNIIVLSKSKGYTLLLDFLERHNLILDGLETSEETRVDYAEVVQEKRNLDLEVVMIEKSPIEADPDKGIEQLEPNNTPYQLRPLDIPIILKGARKNHRLFFMLAIYYSSILFAMRTQHPIQTAADQLMYTLGFIFPVVMLPYILNRLFWCLTADEFYLKLRNRIGITRQFSYDEIMRVDIVHNSVTLFSVGSRSYSADHFRAVIYKIYVRGKRNDVARLTARDDDAKDLLMRLSERGVSFYWDDELVNDFDVRNYVHLDDI